uniref:Uncharacterized protein n=1 Tax=Anopheles funestus TaxID=62324 RepID=A0A182RTU2_ANOFN
MRQAKEHKASRQKLSPLRRREMNFSGSLSKSFQTKYAKFTDIRFSEQGSASLHDGTNGASIGYSIDCQNCHQCQDTFRQKDALTTSPSYCSNLDVQNHDDSNTGGAGESNHDRLARLLQPALEKIDQNKYPY